MNLKGASNLYASVCEQQGSTILVFGGRDEDSETIKFSPEGNNVAVVGGQVFLSSPECMVLNLDGCVYTVGRDLQSEEKFVYKHRKKGWLTMAKVQ